MKQEEKYTSKLGYYPCIYLTLKDVMETKLCKYDIKYENSNREMYQEHRYLLESDKIYPEEKRTNLKEILFYKEDEIVLRNSIKSLSKYLNRHYNKPVMLFLDEYDVPLQNAYVEGYYEEGIKFFKTFYGVTFKDNPYLEKTILTGVSRVAKESIFSGANNFHVYTVLDDEFSDDFGITEKEMDKIIGDFEIQDQKEEIKNGMTDTQ